MYSCFSAAPPWKEPCPEGRASGAALHRRLRPKIAGDHCGCPSALSYPPDSIDVLLCISAQECVPRLLESEAGIALTKTYVAQHSALQAFISASHAEWCTNLSKDLADSLKQPLLSQARPFRTG